MNQIPKLIPNSNPNNPKYGEPDPEKRSSYNSGWPGQNPQNLRGQRIPGSRLETQTTGSANTPWTVSDPNQEVGNRSRRHPPQKRGGALRPVWGWITVQKASRCSGVRISVWASTAGYWKGEQATSWFLRSGQSIPQQALSLGRPPREGNAVSHRGQEVSDQQGDWVGLGGLGKAAANRGRRSSQGKRNFRVQEKNLKQAHSPSAIDWEQREARPATSRGTLGRTAN